MKINNKFVDLTKKSLVEYNTAKHDLSRALKAFVGKKWFDLKPLINKSFEISVIKPDKYTKFRNDNTTALKVSLTKRLCFIAYIDLSNGCIVGFDNCYASSDGKAVTVLPIGYDPLDLFIA